jgi:site-specific DNA recombinase
MGAKLAAIYARLSHDKEGTGQKVDDQITDCRSLAERLDMIVLDEHVYRDDSISASSGRRRPGYEKLLAAIRSDEIDAVLVTETARLDRRLRFMLDYIEACIAHDVETHTVRGGRLDLATRAGRMHAKMSALIDEDYAEQVRERMREGRRHRVSRGQWTGGRRPFGYAEDGVTVIPKERDALQWATAEILSGTSLGAACAKLNEDGITTSTGKPWQPTELRRVLLRPRNAGLMQHRTCGLKQEPGKHHHTDACVTIVGKAEWPALLDETVWRGVCAMLKDPDRRTNTTTAHRWLMSGKARCGALVDDDICGSPVRSFSSTATRRHTKPVYTCRSGKHVVRDAAEVDAYIEDVIIERLSRPDAKDLLTPDLTGDTTALHLQDAALAARLGELGRMFAVGDIDGDTLKAGTEQIRHDRAQITARLAAMSRGSVLSGVADAADPEAAWQGLDLSRKRAIVDVLIDVVILPTRKGRRSGWRAGESYFDPDSVRITWRR